MRSTVNGNRVSGRFSRRWKPAAGAAGVLFIAACGSGSSSSGGAGDTSPIPIGITTSFTGQYQIISQPQLQGVQAAIKAINDAGGVMNRQLKLATGDDTSDPVEAAVACQRIIQVDHIVANVGPASQIGTPCYPYFTRGHIVDFNTGGIPTFDHNTNKLLFRDQTSDTATGLAMGLYAAQKGYKTGLLMMENEPSAEGFKAPIKAAFEKFGGQIIGDIDLQSSQASYRTEVVKAIAMHPDVIFTETPSAAGPMFANFKELNNLAIPIIGSDSTADPQYIKAIGGPDVAIKALTSMTGATPSGPAFDKLAGLIKSMFNTTPGGNAPNTYDAVVMIALAMDLAKSTAGDKVAEQIPNISNPPGTKCTDYAGCLALLNQGQKINFEGAGGSDDFDKFHNVYTDYVAVKVDQSGENFSTVGTVSAADVTKASQ